MRTATRAWSLALCQAIEGNRLIKGGKHLCEIESPLCTEFGMRYPVTECPGRQLSNRNFAEHAIEGKGLDIFVRIASLQGDYGTTHAVSGFWEADLNEEKRFAVLQFQIRGGEFNAHLWQASSDIWVQAPYDLFTYSMIAARALAVFNEETGMNLELGTLYWTCASAAVQEAHREAVETEIVAGIIHHGERQSPLPTAWLGNLKSYENLEKALKLMQRADSPPIWLHTSEG